MSSSAVKYSSSSSSSSSSSFSSSATFFAEAVLALALALGAGSSSDSSSSSSSAAALVGAAFDLVLALGAGSSSSSSSESSAAALAGTALALALALGAGSSSSSSSSAMTMPGGRMPPPPGMPISGGFTDVPGSLALIVEMPVMGPAVCVSAGAPGAPGSAGAPGPPAEGSAGVVLLPPGPVVSCAVGGTMVCAGPASAPASRAAASAPASAASLICSSTVPNRSGLLATKLAKFASTSSAKADSFRARSTRASFWCFHLGSSSRTFRWLDISSAGISWPVMGHRCMRRGAVAFLCLT
mmetsp:Transcript_93639/g.288821  ORF Transcript_93639/g.288821 Transcript_93639/m.288821 type:complete len:298 (-) Transcript_93639:388-1281(-)